MTVHTLPHHDDPRPLKLGFLSSNNPYDRCSFSGTAFFAARALEAHPGIELRILGPHRPPHRFDRVFRRKKPEVKIDPLETNGLDAVLGLVASPLLDQLIKSRPSLPVLHVTDATPAFLREAYGWSIPPEADVTETRVASRAARTIYSSPQIAARAAKDLGLPGIVTDCAPFGVNFDHLPQICPEKPALTRLNLLFVGLDWTRKGGDMAVATLDALLARGIAARLSVVGRCPEKHRAHPAITYAGYLNKNRPRDAQRLAALYAQSHVFLLPSRADCTPMVVSEAMAHGTPVIATDTGGIAAQIGNNGAGRVMPAFATPDGWAAVVAEITSERAAYDFMSDASFDRAQSYLSWQSWAEKIERITRTCLAPAQPVERDLKIAVQG